MQEQLITFETAKLAKSRGFNENVLYHYGSVYTPCVNDDGLFMDDVCDSEIGLYEFSAPTQSLLQKWLREEHILYVIVDWTGTSWSYKFNGTVKGNANTYEEALEKGLHEALKLIKY